MTPKALRQRLSSWQEAGLLDEPQALRILAFEQARGGARAAQWGAWLLGAMGALAIAVGLISLVAANWERLPVAVKLGGGLGLLTGSLAAAAWASRASLAWVRSALLVLYVGLVLANIGLVAQVYHLSGPLWQSMTVACLLALPAAAVARHGLVGDLALGLGVVALLDWMNARNWGLQGGDLRIGVVLAAVAAALFLAGTQVQRVHAAVAGALRRWGLGLAAAGCTWAAVVWSLEKLDRVMLGAGPVAVLVLASGALVAVLLMTRAPGARLAALGVGLGVALLLGPALLAAQAQPVRQGVGFLLFCAAWLAVAVASSEARSSAGVNVATGLVAARVFALYLELVDDLLTTGVGLILTGVVFCALAWGWWRFRRALPTDAATTGGAS